MLAVLEHSFLGTVACLQGHLEKLADDGGAPGRGGLGTHGVISGYTILLFFFLES